MQNSGVSILSLPPDILACILRASERLYSVRAFPRRLQRDIMQLVCGQRAFLVIRDVGCLHKESMAGNLLVLRPEHVKTLRLCKPGVPSLALKWLFDAGLVLLRNLEHLSVDFRFCPLRTCEVLFQRIHILPRLEEFGACNIYDPDRPNSWTMVRTVAKALPTLRGLRQLHLENIGLGSGEGPVRLAETLSALSGLSHLNICRNSFMAEGIQQFSNDMRSLTGLRHLNIGSNTLHDGGARILGEQLVRFTNLEFLDVSGNGFSSNGATHIAEAIRALPLQHLMIGANYISDAGSKALAGALRRLTALKVLSMNEACIGVEGIRCTAESLTWLTRLEELDLSGNLHWGIHPKIEEGLKLLQSLAQQLSKLACLRTLKLMEIEAGDEGATLIADSISGLTKLETLHAGVPKKIWKWGNHPPRSERGRRYLIAAAELLGVVNIRL